MPPEVFHPVRFGGYVLLSKLGHGGMAEVYKARRDGAQGFRKTLCVKRILPEFVGDQSFVAMFVREAKISAGLSHPNIVQVHELGEVAGEFFMAMEYVSGRDLLAVMRQLGGRRTPPPALSAYVACGVSRALQHAHEHRGERGEPSPIIHRDVSPQNVMVGFDGVVKLLDFGIAKAALEAGQEQTRSGTLKGKLGYLAPEQIQGQKASPQTDVFAVGVTLYEMLSGRRLFKGTSDYETMYRVRTQYVPPPSKLNPEVPAELDRILAGALERDPARRYATAGELARDLERLCATAGFGERELREFMVDLFPERGEIPDGVIAEPPPPEPELPAPEPSPPPTAPAPKPVDRRRRRVGALAGAGLLLTGLLLTGLAFLRTEPAAPTGTAAALSSPAGRATARRAVAILGFKNLSGRADAAWLSPALAEMLATELAGDATLRTISGESVARMKIELQLADADTLAAETLTRVHKNLGADLVVLGSYLSMPASGATRLRLDLKVQDASGGAALAALAETGTESELFDVVTRLGVHLRERLGAQARSEATDAERRTLRPASVDAEKVYAEGLARLRAFDALGARERLERAIAIDPEFALAHSALAEALTHLGRDAEAAAEARRAYDRSSALPRDDRLLIEARHFESTHQWPKAIAAYRDLYERAPDDVERGLRLATSQHISDARTDAMATLARLRRLPPPAGDDPRIDLTAAAASEYTGDSRETLVASQRAAREGEARGMPLVVAEARCHEGFAQSNLGAFPAALAAMEEARRISQSVGDRAGVGRALTVAGTVTHHGGDLAGAVKAYREALSIYQELGSALLTAETSNGLAQLEILAGQLRDARGLLAGSLALCREIGSQDVTGDGLVDLGRLEWLEGRLDRAQRSFAEARSIFEATGDRRMKAWALSNLGDLLLEQDDRVAAAASQKQALALREQGSYPKFVAESRLSLAALAIEDGHPEEAEVPARETAQLFRELDSRDLAATAELTQARAILARGGPGAASAAGAAIDRAIQLAGKSEDVEVRERVAIAAARLHAEDPQQRAGSRTRIEASLAEAERLGLVDLQLEARLALADLERRTDRGRARADLETLRRDATARGFLRIARHAATLARTPR